MDQGSWMRAHGWGCRDEVVLKGQWRKQNHPEGRATFGVVCIRGVVLVEYRIQNVGVAVTSDEQTILKKR